MRHFRARKGIVTLTLLVLLACGLALAEGNFEDEVTKVFLYPRGKLIKNFASQVNLVPGQTIIILSPDSVLQIKEWYQKNIPPKGWEERPDLVELLPGLREGGSQLEKVWGQLAFKKQEKVGTVTILPDEESGQTLIFIQIRTGPYPPKHKISTQELRKRFGLPVYPGINEVVYIEDRSAEGLRQTIMYDTTASGSDVISFYRQKLGGLRWEEASLPLTGMAGMSPAPTYFFSRGDGEQLLINVEEKATGSSVLLIYQRAAGSGSLGLGVE